MNWLESLVIAFITAAILLVMIILFKVVVIIISALIVIGLLAGLLYLLIKYFDKRHT